MTPVKRQGIDELEYVSVTEDGHPVEPYTLVTRYEDGRIEVQDTSPTNPYARARILGARPLAEMLADKMHETIAWKRLSPQAQREALRDAKEWQENRQPRRAR